MHTTQVKVRFYELDPYGHVNHTNYLAYFEAARVEYLEELGMGLLTMRERGWHIVVVELSARFNSAAGLNDLLTIETRVGEVGRAASTWHQSMTRGSDPVATLEVRAAFTDLDGRPRRVPSEFAAAVAGGDAPPSVSSARE
ncbi:MAG: acyl-CoA thioesterase [Actinomycetota bacterium]